VLRERLGIPTGLEIVGAVAMGFAADSGDERAGKSADRRRRAPEEIIHVGRW